MSIQSRKDAMTSAAMQRMGYQADRSYHIAPQPPIETKIQRTPPVKDTTALSPVDPDLPGTYRRLHEHWDKSKNGN